MKVLDTIIEGTNPPNKKYRVLWVNPQDKKLRYFNKGVWEELDCMLGNTSNLDKYVGFYTQSNSATTVYPTNWPQLELYISDGKLMCTTGLFGGAVGMGEVELKYDEVNDVLIFEASEESPVFHNELGPIISKHICILRGNIGYYYFIYYFCHIIAF